MQYQVPQFIESEDKVVGPFSLRQFMYVGGAGLISAIFYFLVQTWLFLIFATILVGGALAVSFIKIQGRPLIKVMTAAMNYYWKPQTYVWQAEHPVLRPRTQPAERGLPVEDMMASRAARDSAVKEMLSDSPLHKSWEDLQTGAPLDKKTSDKQFLEQKMSERYQIFQRVTGDRSAARRVDYR